MISVLNNIIMDFCGSPSDLCLDQRLCNEILNKARQAKNFYSLVRVMPEQLAIQLHSAISDNRPLPFESDSRWEFMGRMFGFTAADYYDEMACGDLWFDDWHTWRD